MFESILSFLRDHGRLLKGVALVSAVFFLTTPILAPAFIVLMPSDMLVRSHKRRSPLSGFRRLLIGAGCVVRNTIGVILMLLGLLLLFLPGQGLLTIFAGAMLTDVPGKMRLLGRLLGLGKIRPAVERLRCRFHRDPLIFPGEETA